MVTVHNLVIDLMADNRVHSHTKLYCFALLLVMVALYVIGQTIIFLPRDFFLFFLAYLSGCRLDVYHTSSHGVALV